MLQRQALPRVISHDLGPWTAPAGDSVNFDIQDFFDTSRRNHPHRTTTLSHSIHDAHQIVEPNPHDATSIQGPSVLLI